MGAELEQIRGEIREGLSTTGQTSTKMASLAGQIAILSRDVSAEVDELLKGTATEVDLRMIEALDLLYERVNQASEEFGEVTRITSNASFHSKVDGWEDHCADD